MVPKKRKSKRQTLQAKYRIVKRTKEHKKRLKKGAIVNFKKKPNAENHIPSLWPYKEDLLKEIQTAKDKMEELKIRQKEKRREEAANKSRGGNENSMNVENAVGTKRPRLNVPATSTADDDSADDDDFQDDSIDIKSNNNLGQNSRRAYLKELRKVVETADVILHVLDARDPLGTRSSSIEEMVLSKANKRLVFILNKADLVPRDVLVGWLTYLRKFHPTLPFKSNTQIQKGNLGTMSGKVNNQHINALQSNQAVGAEELLGLLKNYARSGDTKTIISVGCVGFPNVGKSSLVNSLLRSRAVGVSSTPGFTKQTQEVILDKTIRLIDSPGIVFADGDSAAVTLRNCVHVESLEDVMSPIQAILEKAPQHYLMQLYNIPSFEPNNVMAFLSLIARTTGKLKKGGIPNTAAAAKVVLHNWNDGKIKYYIMPPSLSTTTSTTANGTIIQNKNLKTNVSETVLVSEYSNEFDMSEMGEADIRVLNQLEAVSDLYENNQHTGIQLREEDLVINFGDSSSNNNNKGKKNTKKSNNNEDEIMAVDDSNITTNSTDNKKRKLLTAATSSSSSSSLSTTTPGKVGIVKLSKKAIAAASLVNAATADRTDINNTTTTSASATGTNTGRRPPKQDKSNDVISVAGTAITKMTSTSTSYGGVLSRKQINSSSSNTMNEEESTKDSRKIQKLAKKKATKDQRREDSLSPVAIIKSNTTSKSSSKVSAAGGGGGGKMDSTMNDDNYDFSSDFHY